MNKDLLFQLYAIHSPSGGEKKMRRFIRRYINDYCGNVTMTTDAAGNLLVTKGTSDTYPCLASHMDQVQHDHSRDFECIKGDDVVFGYSARSRHQQGLGADDKNGIWICLECLRTYDVLKVAFFVQEETGCGGSRAVDLQFFKDCRFVIQPDRRGGSDLITDMFCGDVCSAEFVKAIGADAYGYKPESGSVTDVGELVERGVGISCLNLSCGYYEAHTDREFTVLSELHNCLDLVRHIIDTCTQVYPYEYVSYDYGKYYGKYGYGSYYGGYTPVKSIGKPKKSWYDTYDDEMYYFDGGYYDDDYDKMQEYLKTMPDLTFDVIKADYLDMFSASMFFDRDQCIQQLSDIYTDVKYEQDRWWERDSDDDLPSLCATNTRIAS